MRHLIQVCHGKSCSDRGANYIVRRLENDKKLLERTGENLGTYNVEICSCQGKCKEGNVIVIDNTTFTKMNPILASRLLQEKLRFQNEEIIR